MKYDGFIAVQTTDVMFECRHSAGLGQQFNPVMTGRQIKTHNP